MRSPVQISVRPSLDQVQYVVEQALLTTPRPALLPMCFSIPADLYTPTAIYLKLSSGATADYSFLLESATGSSETVGRYSFIGANPRRVLRSGSGTGPAADPLLALQKVLSQDRVVSIPYLKLPGLSGGAVGYLSYDCIRYFEPKTVRPLRDMAGIPDALFMIHDTIVAFDHFYSMITVVTHLRIPEDDGAVSVRTVYEEACTRLRDVAAVISQAETPLPARHESGGSQIDEDGSARTYSSNVGRDGYEAYVTQLQEHIVRGDIIQAVPSQRLSRRTGVHPFDIYRTLRTLNPSPYLFFMSCADFYIVGASPECLVKTDGLAMLPSDPRFTPSQDGDTLAAASVPVSASADARPLRPRIVNHTIAGTTGRGADQAEDNELAAALVRSDKDRAEHVMLVDLARNDVNRVCHPFTVKVDRLMKVDRFSHVQHLTSEVSGVLRPECSRWDAIRAVFPAGTVSGAPKVRAIELVYDLEQEKRGIYAGAVGWFTFDNVRVGAGGCAGEEEGSMDTCICIRTMLVKDGVAHLQAGAGIVHDSVATDEWMETMNKLAANIRCIELAETWFGDRPAGAAAAAKSVAEIIEEERNRGKSL